MGDTYCGMSRRFNDGGGRGFLSCRWAYSHIHHAHSLVSAEPVCHHQLEDIGASHQLQTHTHIIMDTHTHSATSIRHRLLLTVGAGPCQYHQVSPHLGRRSLPTCTQTFDWLWEEAKWRQRDVWSRWVR